MQSVLVATYETNSPCRLRISCEVNQITAGSSFVIVPVGHQRVDHDVSMRYRHGQPFVGPLDCFTTLLTAQTRNIDRTVWTERSYDILDSAVVQCLCVFRDRCPDALSGLGEGRCHRSEEHTSELQS